MEPIISAVRFLAVSQALHFY